MKTEKSNENNDTFFLAGAILSHPIIIMENVADWQQLGVWIIWTNVKHKISSLCHSLELSECVVLHVRFRHQISSHIRHVTGYSNSNKWLLCTGLKLWESPVLCWTSSNNLQKLYFTGGQSPRRTLKADIMPLIKFKLVVLKVNCTTQSLYLCIIIISSSIFSLENVFLKPRM